MPSICESVRVSALVMVICRLKSITAFPFASALRFARAACRFSPGSGSTKSITVVVPPQAAAQVPVNQSSLEAVSPTGICRCTCGSIPPGSTSMPAASISSRPCRSFSITEIFSPMMPTSADISPRLVITLPLRITRSNSIFCQLQSFEGIRCGFSVRTPAPQPVIALQHGKEILDCGNGYRRL